MKCRLILKGEGKSWKIHLTMKTLVKKKRDEDSTVDMWCSVALVILAWAIAMHWLMGT